MLTLQTTADIGATEPSSSYSTFALLQIRAAGIRARLIANEIDSAGAALAGGFIDADEALTWAADAAINLIALSSSY